MIFCTFIWNGARRYTPANVNMLRNAIRYFYPEPHRFICYAENPGQKGWQNDVEVLPFPKAMKALVGLPAPQGKDFPSSYPRLWLFSPDAAEAHGAERIILLDVDAMIVGDLRPLIHSHPADFVGWRPQRVWGREKRLAGGTWMHTLGTHTGLWDKFTKRDRNQWVFHARRAGWNGSDQALISDYFVGDKRDRWSLWPFDCGIHGAQENVLGWNYPPPGARIVHFNGTEKHWDKKKLWIDSYNQAMKYPSSLTVADFECKEACCNDSVSV